MEVAFTGDDAGAAQPPAPARTAACLRRRLGDGGHLRREERGAGVGQGVGRDPARQATPGSSRAGPSPAQPQEPAQAAGSGTGGPPRHRAAHHDAVHGGVAPDEAALPGAVGGCLLGGGQDGGTVAVVQVLRSLDEEKGEQDNSRRERAQQAGCPRAHGSGSRGPRQRQQRPVPRGPTRAAEAGAGCLGHASRPWQPGQQPWSALTMGRLSRRVMEYMRGDAVVVDGGRFTALRTATRSDAPSVPAAPRSPRRPAVAAWQGSRAGRPGAARAARGCTGLLAGPATVLGGPDQQRRHSQFAYPQTHRLGTPQSCGTGWQPSCKTWRPPPQSCGSGASGRRAVVQPQLAPRAAGRYAAACLCCLLPPCPPSSLLELVTQQAAGQPTSLT